MGIEIVEKTKETIFKQPRVLSTHIDLYSDMVEIMETG